MLRAAVVGLGIGRVHVEELKKNPDTDLVAVVDMNMDLCKEVAARHGLAAFASISDLLAKEKLDYISLCTPPSIHAEQVEQCAAAGIHCLVEKPMAASLADCRRMIDATRNAGVKLMIAQKKRFSGPYAFLKQKFENDFGQPLWACVKFALGRVPRDWFWAEDDGGGPVLENAIHMWDLLRFLMGEVELVTAVGGNLFMPEYGFQIDSAAASLKFVSGGIATVACGYASEWGFANEKVSIASRKVSCDIAGGFDNPTSLIYIHRDKPGDVKEMTFAQARGFQEEFEEFIAAIKEDRDPCVTGEDAAGSIAVALAVKRSIREQRPIKIADMK